MSTTVLAPSTSTPSRPRRGLASIKTMFSVSKRQPLAQIPTAEQSTHNKITSSSSPSDSNDSGIDAHGGPVPTQAHSIFSSSSSSRRSIDKAAEKQKKEQVKHAIQLSDVNDLGAFVAPPPLEKGYRDHFRDNDQDFFFDTILNTPSERVHTFLSAAKTISPGMFSEPSSKPKRHTFPRHWTPEPAAAAAATVPPVVPPKDDAYHKNQGVHMSFVTSSEDIAEALSESIGSLLTSASSSSSSPVLSSSRPHSPSSPMSSTMSEEVPDLMMDDEDQSDASSSAHSSPRHSTAMLPKEPLSAARAQKARQLLDLGGDLDIPVEL
ncbi:hypothetical protein BGZ94_004444 [Podila epigama]|nr:hypothetical protein BGZ94_004444 [Podila epigama]